MDNIIKSAVKEYARNIIYYTKRVVTKKKIYGLEKQSKVHVFSDGKNATFFGYHDKSPFSMDQTKLLAMSVNADDANKNSEGSLIKLGYFEISHENLNNKFIGFSHTETWCWQQGCMLQWYPTKSNTHVMFNCLIDGNYGSKLLDIRNNKEEYRFRYPIYSLSKDGKYAINLNFNRLGRLRPGYGYTMFKDSTEGMSAPSWDGLFILDILTGSRVMLVSLYELSKNIEDEDVEHYINHATFSPDGKSIVFFHIWVLNSSKKRKLRVCVIDLETRKWRVIESKRLVSHYCWKDSETILATTCEDGVTWKYTEYNIYTDNILDLDLSIGNDGHPMYNPSNTNMIITDTYPDKRRDQHLCIVHIDKQKTFELATLKSPPKYRGQVRCDLHPRWDNYGKFVSVDTTAYGKRKMLVLSV